MTAHQDALIARSQAKLLAACKPRAIRPISPQRRNDLRVEFALRAMSEARAG